MNKKKYLCYLMYGMFSCLCFMWCLQQLDLHPLALSRGGAGSTKGKVLKTYII